MRPSARRIHPSCASASAANSLALGPQDKNRGIVLDAVRTTGLRFAYPPSLPGESLPSPGEPASWVLDGLDLQVPPGQWLAVMGASDTGKTTLCLLLAGLAPHLTGGTLEGQILVAGRDTQRHPPPALADTVGIVFQETEAQLFNVTVEAEVAWGLENLGLPAEEIRARIDAVLSLLRLEPVRHRAPEELSGGEKKRVALASVLATRPALLILDEPLGGLDPAGRAEVLAALSALRREMAATIIMTETDPEPVTAFADRVAVLERPTMAVADGKSRPGAQIGLDGPPRAVFGQVDRLASFGVAIPHVARVAAGLNQRLGTAFDFSTLEQARDALVAYLD
jgi:energy-coupling factor transporter ATP-binding protein EcfA2